MAAKCGVCQLTTRNKPKVTCSGCSTNFHLNCADLTPEDASFLESNQQIWRCEPCGKSRRKSMMLESKSEVSFDDVLKLFTELKSDIKGIEKNLGDSLCSCHEELKETNKKLEDQKRDIMMWVQKIEELTSENLALKKQVKSLEVRLQESEQYSRKNCIEIHGIPSRPNEDVVEIVKSVGQALDYPITDTMVDACHRLPSNGGTDRPAGIIVKMVRRLDAEGLLHKRRVKRNLNTRDIGLNLPEARPVYLNESLSPARRKIFNAARQAKKDKNYTYLWVRGGKVFMREADGKPVKVINSEEDLNSL